MIILIYIVEASGLNYPNHKIVATASLGRNVLETKVSSPRNTTRFDSSLAWKTDITSIKRMKSDNIPIKVECFCVGKVEREMIGFVVVPLRSVNILTGNKVMTITPKWHRFIGLRHAWKTLKPEILMFVTITDVVGVQIVNEMRNSTSTATRNMLVPQQGIEHIELNRKEQHIQIGDPTIDCHRFTVEIYLHHCEWLSYLTENPSSTEDSFQMRYTLLDCPTEERNLPKMCGSSDDERYMVHEKITIQLRSSLKMMRKYFENVFYIPIYIYCKEDIVGRVFFKISSALPDTNDLNDFLLLTKDDTFVAINESFIYPTKPTTSFIDDEHRPTIKYNFTLKYHDPSKETGDNQLSHRLPQASEVMKRETSSENHKYFASENHQSDAKNKNYLPDEQLKTQSCDSNVEPDHVLPTGRETVEQSIQRRNVLIQKLLNSQMGPTFSPKNVESIRFVDVTSPQLPQPQSQTYRQIDLSSPPSRITTSPAGDTHCRSPKSVTFNPQLPSQSEDELAWKSKQQEAFLTGLKRKESEHLKSLADEWLHRQCKEEEKLSGKMKKCKLLTEALEHALSTIKEKNTISMDHQRLDEAARLEQKKHYDEKISALKDQMRRTAIDHDYQLKLMEIKLKEMEMKRKFTDDENDKLKVTVKRLEEENELLRGRHMELDSMTSRKLQSMELKLKHAQELEAFYKNKWQSAECKLNEMQATRHGNFSQSNRHLSARVVDVLNSVRSDLEADKFELQSIKDMLE